MIKSGFFVVDTVHRGKKLLFAYPDQMPEDIFSSTDEPSQKYDNSQNMQEIFMANFFKNMNFFGKISTKNIFGFDTDVLVELFSPKENKSNSSFEIIIEDSLFISQPVFINWHNSNNNEENKEKLEKNDMILLNSFNFVIICTNEFNTNIAHLQDLLTFFSRGFEFLDQKKNFVSKYIKRIFDLNEKFRSELKNLPKFEAKNNEELKEKLKHQILKLSDEMTKSIEIFKIFMDFLELIKKNSSKSSLEKNSTTTQIEINQLLKITYDHTILTKNITENTLIDIKPYQTLVLSRRRCIDSLDTDSSPRLAIFITNLNPRKSFEDISMQFDFSFNEIRFYVSHLMKWQKAVIINPLTKFSSFTINPNFVFDRENKNFVFEALEKNTNEDSFNIMKNFECPIMVKNLTNIEFNTVIRLLQCEYLKETNKYIYLKLNENDKFDKIKHSKNFTEKDLKISNLLKNYALKNFHIHEIGWRECLTIKEIVEFLEKHNQTFGTYYL